MTPSDKFYQILISVDGIDEFEIILKYHTWKNRILKVTYENEM